METTQMIQKAAAMGNWWLAASSRQHIYSCILSYAEFFWQNVKSSRWVSPPKAQICHPGTSGFSQNKNHLWKGRDFRQLMRFRKIRQGSWLAIVRSQGAYCEGDWGIIVLHAMYLISSSINVSIFCITWLNSFWRDLILQQVVVESYAPSLFICYWSECRQWWLFFSLLWNVAVSLAFKISDFLGLFVSMCHNIFALQLGEVVSEID